MRFIGLDLLSNVAAAIGGRIDSLMRSIGSSGNELGKSFAQVGKVAVGMGAGLLAVSAALTAVVVGTASAAATFEQKMTLLHTQAGASTAEVRAMTQAVLDLAPAVGYGPDKLADAMYHVESLGFRGAKALNLLEVAAKGAQIGNADLESTVNALGGVLVAEIGGVNNAAQAMAVLDATVGVGNMRMQDLVNALSTGVVPAGKNFGLTLQEINGALATLTDNAVPADEAATRLRMTFALIGAPTTQATKQLASIGISQLQLATDMRKPNGLVVALTDLQQHLRNSGKSAEEQSYIITRAFGGGRSSAGIMTLLNNLDRLNQRTQQITAMTGTFSERFAERAQNANFALAQLHATFERLVIVIGTAVLPVFAMVIKFITPIISAIGLWVEHHQRLTAMILIGGIIFTALAGIFLVVFGTIAIMLGGLLALIAALPMLGAAVAPVLIAIGITFGVMVALAAAIFGVIWAIQHWSEITAVAQRVWGFVGPYITAAINAIADVVHGFVDTTLAWWRAHGEQVRIVWEAYVATIRTTWDVIWRVISTAITIIVPFIESAFGNLGDIISTAWDLIVNTLRTAWDVILTIVSVALDVLTGDWGRAWDDLSSGLGRIFDDIVRTATQFGGDLVHGIVNGIARFGGDVGKAVETIMPGPLKKFLGIGQEVGTQISTGIAAGIDAGKGLIDRAAERSTAIVAPTSVPTSGRAQDVIPIGPQRLAPQPSGISQAWAQVTRVINEAVGNITGIFAGLVRNADRLWQQFSSAPAYWWGRAVGTVVFGAMTMYQQVVSWLTRMVSQGILAFMRFNDAVTVWVNALPGIVTTWLEQVVVRVAVWAVQMARAADRAGNDFARALGNWFQQLPGNVANWLGQVIAAANRWVVSMGLAAQQGATSFTITLTRALGQLAADMVEVGRNIVTGIISGIFALRDWAGQQIGNFVRGLVDAATQTGRGGSPMMLFADEVGAPAVQGVVVGINEEAGTARSAMSRLLDSLASPGSASSVGVVTPHTSAFRSEGVSAARAVDSTVHVSVAGANNATDNATSELLAALVRLSDTRLGSIERILSRIADDGGTPPTLAAQLRAG